jgi:glutamate dehydrogenase/leucine dehydrogenase
MTPVIMFMMPVSISTTPMIIMNVQDVNMMPWTFMMIVSKMSMIVQMPQRAALSGQPDETGTTEDPFRITGTGLLSYLMTAGGSLDHRDQLGYRPHLGFSIGSRRTLNPTK